MAIKRCPRKYRDIAEWCVDLFGLEDMQVCVDEKDTPGEHEGSDGICYTNGRYNQVWVEIRRKLPKSEYKHILLHEFFHAALIEVNHAVINRIIELVPETQRDHAEELFTDALERTTERVSRSIERMLDLSVEAEVEEEQSDHGTATCTTEDPIDNA